MRIAIVKICFHGGDYSFRCPACQQYSDNAERCIQPTEDGINFCICECGAIYSLPTIELCDCEDHQAEINNAEQSERDGVMTKIRQRIKFAEVDD